MQFRFDPRIDFHNLFLDQKVFWKRHKKASTLQNLQTTPGKKYIILLEILQRQFMQIVKQFFHIKKQEESFVHFSSENENNKIYWSKSKSNEALLMRWRILS